jgi:DNA-directed RNA polymerase subunit RPC12/RpoP
MSTQNISLETFAPTIVLSRTETQRVACPYCSGGYTEVTATHTGDKMEIPGFKEPHKCMVCKRYFKLVPRVQVVGEQIEGE